MDIDVLKNINIVKKIKPDFIAKSKKIGNDFLLEEWYTKPEAIPKWWNEDTHIMIEVPTIAGQFGLTMFCIKCNKKVSGSGCPHNKD